MAAFRYGPFGPNQVGTFAPQNNEGLGFNTGAGPGQQVMFNLPRWQMPGTNVNFGQGDVQGAFPGSGSLKFSISRQASSDPVQNILNDIVNPLSGAQINFGGQFGGAPSSPLKERLLSPNTTFGPQGFFDPMGQSGASQFSRGGGAYDLAHRGTPSLSSTLNRNRPQMASFSTPGGGLVSRYGMPGDMSYNTNDPMALQMMQMFGIGAGQTPLSQFGTAQNWALGERRDLTNEQFTAPGGWAGPMHRRLQG